MLIQPVKALLVVELVALLILQQWVCKVQDCITSLDHCHMELSKSTTNQSV